MKTVVAALGISLALSAVAGAQVVVGPPDHAGSAYSGGSYTGATEWNAVVLVGYGRENSDWHGVFEFDLAAAGLPLPEMTAYNFTAQLNDIEFLDAEHNASGSCVVELYDLDDSSEDNDVSLDDFGNSRGSSIEAYTFIWGEFPPQVTEIDVTVQLHRDLFGEGQGQETTGFILISPDADFPQWISFDGTKPKLVINVGVPNNLDADPDAGANDEDDNGFSTSRDSCGCRAVGESSILILNTPLLTWLFR